jgi:hypothetical protein
MGLSAVLRQIAGLGLLEREAEIEDGITVRLESADFPTNKARGEIIRRQMSNLPPKALSGQRLERLGVEAIGHSTAFLYCRRLSILAFEQARNGITSTRFGLYIAHFAGGVGYDILPAPTQEMWETLRAGRLRAIRVRCAAPQSLEAADAEAEAVKSGLVSLQGVLDTHYIDATLGMKRGDPDIQRNTALRWFNWFRRERENRAGWLCLDRFPRLMSGTSAGCRCAGVFGVALAPLEQPRARRSRQGTDPPWSPLLPLRGRLQYLCSQPPRR